MDHFVNICKSRDLSIHEIPNGISRIRFLADLVLNDTRYVIPVFSSFKSLTLPIVSEWILGLASTETYELVFTLLSTLATLLPHLRPLMEHLLVMRSSTSSFLSGSNDREVLLGIIRLLLLDYSRFSGYFTAEELRSVASRTEIVEIRSLALVALSLLMEVSENQLENWVSTYCGNENVIQKLEYTIILQAAQAKVEGSLLLKSDVPERDLPTENESYCEYENVLVTNINGVFVPRLGGVGKFVNQSSFVNTENSSSNLRRVALSLLTDQPILLVGDHGSGKTTLITHIHTAIRGGDLLRIHLGDQTDAKALIGTFTTGSKPGTFEWVPGALTTAVKAGSWVLIEDIDRAPNDIVAILLSLLTRRELVIPSRNEVIRAAPGFQLVATTTTQVSSSGEKKSAEIIGARNWIPVLINSPSNSDLESLIQHQKPFMTHLASSMLVSTLRRVEEFQDHHRLSRLVSTRDLMKLSNRIGKHYTADDIFREAVACFTSFLSQPLPLARVIGDSMGIGESQVEPLLSRHQPALSTSDRRVIIGRAEIERRSVTSSGSRNLDNELHTSKFALTLPTLRLLEEIGVAVQHSEPVLLVGETGTGKTAIVQHLAKLVRRKLVVINVSQQVEAGDLIGGFKPVDASQLAGPLLEEFNELFDATFNRAKNHQFLEVLERIVKKKQWTNVVKLFKEAGKMANSRKYSTNSQSKLEGTNSENNKRPRIDHHITSDWDRFIQQVGLFEQRLKSIEHSAQFQFIEGLLVRAIRQGSWVLLDEINLAPSDTIEGISEILSNRQLTMLEAGGQVVSAHPDFRLFANMNPATDVGKRDLPAGVRSQFTELWSPSPDTDPAALRAIIAGYLPLGTETGIINDVACLYSESRALAEAHHLVDGSGQRPHFSIRTLSRALSTATLISKTYGLRRAIYEAFCMCFMTLLDAKSEERLQDVVNQYILQKLPNRNSVLNQAVSKPTSGNYIQFAHWWMPCGQYELEDAADYILTPSVERNLLNLVRASSTRMFPILIQGPTSSGKTSMVSYLAKRTGHRIVRINNHEHTDLAEYLGGYESDADGKLVFKEGALVQALRNGHWLILDELNLAPTDVLEALNRLLDDNRELLVPETQEIVKPHPNFILFATQNPPGLYAGRKVLSRAFRNRFLELHFGDIPDQELEIILRDRTRIAPRYASKIVEVYQELSRQRIQRLFESGATLRDLFRWARRPAIGYEQLAFNGYALLGERSRSKQEREAVKAVIERVMKVKVDTDIGAHAPKEVMSAAPADIVWTGAMRRVLALVDMALAHNEPVLLVGETGCGKTTIVQAIAAARNCKLVVLNAHQNTETGDLVGSQRPVRSSKSAKLFEWVDGPLVSALRDGSMFLLDEISLADDSVLERLNSVLEYERTLFVPEIGSIEAQEGFHFLSTMNPGGDYGKKELSPALRNRFTEIWCPTVDDENDLRLIVDVRLRATACNEKDIDHATNCIVRFSLWFSNEFGVVSLRDILSWIDFINVVGLSDYTLAHGACMVLIDGLGARLHLLSHPNAVSAARGRCLKKLSTLLGPNAVSEIDSASVSINPERMVHIGSFELPIANANENKLASTVEASKDFSLKAPTSALNAMRVVRAMQVHKPILLEGPPGAGKTSLVGALSKLCNVQLTRINLSDQTDLSDLFGQDVPLNEPGKFGWRDAPFLRAMQSGEWVLLDEMNLAPQAVLEGLNACLDHRGEAYIPELDRTFSKHPKFMVFAAQNPQGQGGGRKGLPKSFVNRFSVVYVDQLGLQDLHIISSATHPGVPASVRENLATYVEELAQWSSRTAISGGPFEFNLRDTMRWLDLVSKDQSIYGYALPQNYLSLIVLQRLRTDGDRQIASKMFYKYFSPLHLDIVNPAILMPNKIKLLNTELPRNGMRWQVHDSLAIIPRQLPILQTGLYCVENNWLLILAGSSGSGKTSIIRLLAQIYGTKLREFAVTADVDSTDLLGEFDQLEYKAELQRLWALIEDESCSFNAIDEASLFDAIRRRDLNTVSNMIPAESAVIHNAISEFKQQDFSKPIFHWVDGMLVRAIENGDWLVLDNANLCSAAVLDRLNSLMERNGTLLMNECTQLDGTPRVVKPHPNFRLFMTVDPRYGELSRAMRNRGVEIWMDDESSYSNYDVMCKSDSTVASALPLQFSRPQTLARIADLRSNSWLRTITVDERTTPVQYITAVDGELGRFFETEKISDVKDLGSVHESWMQFKLKQRLAESLVKQDLQNLLDISALHQVRDSIDCEFDIYSLISSGLHYKTGEEELASVLIDLTMVRDPSRVPVFRNWLLKYSANHNLQEFGQLVKRSLGKEYDFSKGGLGMERLWQRFGRHLGFKTKDDHDELSAAIHLGKIFDELIRKLSVEYADQVTDLLALLASVNRADEQLVSAVKEFQEIISKSAGNVPKLLTKCFDDLWFSLALVYATKASNSTRNDLKNLLPRVAFLAEKDSENLRSLLIAKESELNVPEIIIPRTIEQTIVDILNATKQGQARLEINEFSSVLGKQSKAVALTVEPQVCVIEIVKRTAHKVLETVPEACDKKSIVDLLALKNDDGLAVANGAISLAYELLSLYVCPLPLDPAIAQHVWYDRFVRLQEEFKSDTDCWEQLKFVFGSQSPKIERWLSNRQIQHTQVPSIWRPRDSQIAMIHQDMLAAVQLAASAQNGVKTNEEIDLIQRNADHLSMRLTRATGYADLVSVVRAALALVKIGLSLWSRNINHTSDKLVSYSSLWLLDPIMISTKALDDNEHPLLALRSMCFCKPIPLDKINDLLTGIYQGWTLERLKLDERRREEAAGFKYDDAEDEDVVVEREFRLLFPDYDEITELPQQQHDYFVPSLVELYCRLMTGVESLENDPVGSIVDTIVNSAEQIKNAEGISSSRNLPALFLALRNHGKEPSQPSSSAFNFYTDSNPSEFHIGLEFAEKTRNRTLKLISTWPEHNTLLSLMRVTGEIIELAPHTPVALHLSKVEQIHHHLFEWDRFASKEVKVTDLMADASRIVVRWRRLELATWPAMFKVEKRKAAEAAAPFWFHLFETLISTPSEELKATAKILILFMAESNIGQFERRLAILRAFRQHLELLGKSNICQCVSNIIQYYTQFIPGIRETINRLEMPLRKQVDEVVQLASWKDVNIHALKQSAQRSHRQLFKIVKKYRLMLETKANTELDITSISTRSLNNLKGLGVVSPTNPTFHWSNKLVDSLRNTDEWNDLPKYLQDLDKTVQMVGKYNNKVAEFGEEVLKRGNLLSFAVDIQKRAADLRKETPNVWTKETKKIISALRVEKQALLTATLRELKDSGLKPAINKTTFATQAELSHVLATSPHLGNIHEDGFFCMIDILPRLRSAVSEATLKNSVQDVPQSDLYRGMAYAENAFAQVLKLRRIAAKHSRMPSLEERENCLANMSTIAYSPINVKFDDVTAKMALDESSNLVKNVIEVVMSTLSATSQGSQACEVDLMKLKILANSTSELTDLNIRSSEVNQWFESSISRIHALEYNLESNESSGLVSSIVSETSSYLSNFAKKVTKLEPCTHCLVNDAVSDASKPVLIVIQQIIKILTDFQTKTSGEDESDTNWFTSTIQLAERLLLTLRSGDIWSKFTFAANMIYGLSITAPQLAGSQAARLAVFLNAYMSLTREVESLFERVLINSTEGTIKLSTMLFSLATEGFCSPIPTEEDDEEDEAQGDGVGLGDGQGGKNSSKDVDEGDDDVSEAMKTSNPDQQERDEAETEDNAKEMEGDMAGEKEDMLPQDGEDSGDSENDEENDDIDDEIGDVDDLDPNSIDEKMWDDQKETGDDKEKETDKGIQGNQGDDPEAAKESNEESQQGEAGEGNQEGDVDREESSDMNNSEEAHESDREGEDDEQNRSDIEGQDDDINQGDKDQLQPGVEQNEVLDLPEDMQLDDNPAENENEEADENNADDADDAEGALDGNEVENNSELPDEMENKPDNAEEENLSENFEDTQNDNDGESETQDPKKENEDSAMDVDEEERNQDSSAEPDNQVEDSEVGETNTESVGDGKGTDIEGIDGPSENLDEKPNEDQATTSETKTQTSGKGASEDASNEQESVGDGGSSAASSETRPPNDQENPSRDDSTNAIQESLKQLGDAMKEFHRRQRAIKEQEPGNDIDEVNDADAENELTGTEDFEHVGETDKFDTQALGKGTNEQTRQEIDNSMAIDDDENQTDAEEQEVAGDEDQDAEMGAGAGGDAAFNGSEVEDDEQQSSAVVGDLRDDQIEEEEEEDNKQLFETQTEEPSSSAEKSSDLWQLYESKTHDLALILGEQLRLILEPTVASKLRGDYRTGKRLNMKRIIPYIASEFRKDKIWLRRTKPAKREYQILLALDDSKSMGEPAVVDLAFQAIALVGKALETVEAGEIGVAKFGASTEILHALGMPFTPQAADNVFRQFGFNQQRTNIHQLLRQSLDMFGQESTSSDQWKLEIIISDGITDDHSGLRTLVRRAYDERVMVVFVVLDALNRDTSILDMNEVKYTNDEHGNSKLEVSKYMDDFPFDYYVIVRNIADLPMVLASVLRQYFQAVDL